MTADMRAIEDMLKGYATLLAVDLECRWEGFEEQSVAATREGLEYRLAAIKGMQAECAYLDKVQAAHGDLAHQRAVAEWELFAGPTIPANPIAAAQLRNGLLEDRDCPDLQEYLSLEDWEDQADPLFVAFELINTEMLTWRAETPEIATAIAIAVEWDEREGMGWQWPDRVVRRARKLALAGLSRAW